MSTSRAILQRSKVILFFAYCLNKSAIITYMAKKVTALEQAAELRIRQFGERLRTARLRRRLTAKHLAERAGMTAVTLRNLERGNAGVTIGAYLAVMQVLGVDGDLDLLLQDDPLGRQVQDANLPQRGAI